MDIEINSWLFDIIKAIGEIDGFFAERPKQFADYRNDIRTKRAVERNLEIIGEAVKRIVRKDPTIQLSNAQKIIATRNRIIHAYDSVSDEMIWGIVVIHLPLLKTEIQGLLTGRN